MFAVGCDHALELRQVSVLRSQIERRYIKDRVLDRDHKQVRTADHPRAHLIPQRDLLRYLGTLVDPRFDLERSVDELLLGKLVDDQLAVVGRVAARGEPRDHVVAAAGHHRKHEEELGLRLAGQPHDDVVGGHRCNAAAPRLPRELPEILAVIENVGRLHMVGLIELRLNQKQVLRIANVLLQVRGHSRERLEQARKDTLEGCGDRVTGVHQIKVDGSVIGIDDDLH